MYRASAFLVSNAGINLRDGSSASNLLKKHCIDVSSKGILLDGKDISSKIRTNVISEAASIISTHKSVREHMVFLQREFGKKHNTVAEGRDMGTVVFPKASLKIYIVADIAIRALRRQKDHNQPSVKEIVHSMFKRDYRDRTRTESPLRLPPGGIWLDGTNLTINQQVNFIVKLYKRRMVQ